MLSLAPGVTNVPTFSLDKLLTVAYIIGAGSGKRIPRKGGSMKIYLRSEQNQVRYAIIWWYGSAHMVARRNGDTLDVFPVSSRKVYMAAQYLGYFRSLKKLLKLLEESGGYVEVDATSRAGK